MQLFRLGRCVGTQFHPEVNYAHVEGFLSEAGRRLPGRVRESTLARILEEMRRHEERNARQCAALVDWFLDDVATLASSIGADETSDSL